MKYKILNYTNEIDQNAVFAQAAKTLDITAEIAVKTEDKETLLNVVALWMRMGELLSPSEIEEEEEEIEQTGGVTGFVSTSIRMDEVENE